MSRIYLLTAISFLSTWANGVLAADPLQATEQRYRREISREAPNYKSPAIAPGLTGTEQGRFASYDPQFPPPSGTPDKDIFKLSQDYPSLYDVDEKFPWEDIDYRTNGAAYLKAVLRYCLEGNVEVEFRGQENVFRKWYHAPWLHEDSNDKDAGKRQGREFHHGLTRERRSRSKEVHPLQVTDRVQNWAVGLYTARGGYTIGRVWLTPDGFPDPTRATFPDNTVAFKLLFTAASLEEVPFLKGSFEWTANIDPPAPASGVPYQRVDKPVRLLQLDVAIKDPRVASASGWVFGTFIYDGSQQGKSPWERLVPVGLSWGTDPKERRLMERDGSFLNPYLRESSINASLLEPADTTAWGNRAYVRHLGLGGRLNGPVDNAYSSCISCHARAGTYHNALPLSDKSGYAMPILAGKDLSLGAKDEQVDRFPDFFKTVRPNSHLEQMVDTRYGLTTFVTVDYSLQLSLGIRNFYQALRLSSDQLGKLRGAQGSATDILDQAPRLQRLPSPVRGE